MGGARRATNEHILPAPAPDTRDQTLVHQSIHGSHEAFGLLVVRYSRSVRACCLARVGRCGELDDLVQESFLRAFEGLSRIDHPERFGAYVRRIAHHVCVDRVRRDRRERVRVDEVDLAAPAPASAALDVREERLERLRAHVGRLPLTLREAVLLTYFEQRTPAEIGALLGVTEGAVHQRLHRARELLKQRLGGAEGGA